MAQGGRQSKNELSLCSQSGGLLVFPSPSPCSPLPPPPLGLFLHLLVTGPGPKLASDPTLPWALTGEAARAHPGPVAAGGAGPPARQRAPAAPVCRPGQRHRALDPEQDGGRSAPPGGRSPLRDSLSDAAGAPPVPQLLALPARRTRGARLSWMPSVLSVIKNGDGLFLHRSPL